MNKIIFISALIIFIVISEFAHAQEKARKVYSMDPNWSFFLGDAEEAYKTNFNDKGWEKLNVPHDWSIELPIDENAPSKGSGGFAVTGIGWYRKTFTMPAMKQGQQVRIEFDGIHMRSEVWINGHSLGKRPN
jgi:beta-galactosidase